MGYNCIIESCAFNELNKHTEVFNKSTLQEFIYIKISKNFSDLDLVYVENMDKIVEVVYSSAEVLDDSEYFESNASFVKENRFWIRCKTADLKLDIGQHIYRLVFHNKFDDEIVLYFSYRIQDDNPDKPYVYMNRDDNDIPSSDSSNVDDADVDADLDPDLEINY